MATPAQRSAAAFGPQPAPTPPPHPTADEWEAKLRDAEAAVVAARQRHEASQQAARAEKPRPDGQPQTYAEMVRRTEIQQELEDSLDALETAISDRDSVFCDARADAERRARQKAADRAEIARRRADRQP